MRLAIEQHFVEGRHFARQAGGGQRVFDQHAGETYIFNLSTHDIYPSERVLTPSTLTFYGTLTSWMVSSSEPDVGSQLPAQMLHISCFKLPTSIIANDLSDSKRQA